MTDQKVPEAKTTATRERMAAEQAAHPRIAVRRAIAAQVAPATAAANAQAPPLPDGVGEREHRAVKTLMRLMVDKSGGPVAHVMLGDGRTTEFKSRLLIIEETSEREASDQILFLVINGRGEVLVDAKTGNPIVLPEIPLTVQLIEDPDGLVSIEEAARRVNVSASTIKRDIKSGGLKPVRVGKKSVRLRIKDLKRWIE
jgi:excisionase family DNA binding protein